VGGKGKRIAKRRDESRRGRHECPRHSEIGIYDVVDYFLFSVSSCAECFDGMAIIG